MTLDETLIRYDRIESRMRRYDDPHALALYRESADEVRADCRKGATLKDAITRAFTGGLRLHLLINVKSL